jgi:hypothetical protein
MIWAKQAFRVNGVIHPEIIPYTTLYLHYENIQGTSYNIYQSETLLFFQHKVK